MMERRLEPQRSKKSNLNESAKLLLLRLDLPPSLHSSLPPLLYYHSLVPIGEAHRTKVRIERVVRINQTVSDSRGSMFGLLDSLSVILSR